ncbi:hypothetical protein ACU42Y_18180 [Proteus mirabilis]
MGLDIVMFKDQFTPQQKMDICTFEEGDPTENPWVKGKPAQIHIEIVPIILIGLYNLMNKNR